MNEPTNPAPAPAEAPKEPAKVVSGGSGSGVVKKLLMVILVLLLLAAAAYGGYWWRDRDAKKDSQTSSAKITELEKKVSDLESSNSDVDSDDTEEASVQPTAEQLDNIQASITSGNTAALEGRLADAVTVIIAATEGLGARTPAQAIGDLDYVVSLSATWDFSLPQATLDSFAAGDYAQYFPAGALVGKSSEEKVVSFIFDSNAKIKTIFMSVNSDLLD